MLPSLDQVSGWGEEVSSFKEIVCCSWIPFVSLQQSFNFGMLEMELMMTVWTKLASSLRENRAEIIGFDKGGWKFNQPL